ncbi:hypothetical protein SEA_LITTLEFELLA_28 [Gordonia phage LittleFella]|nr:hypothetical protein SEA_LITTLEFELLA_28 [Gordonia phage LittleFella]
MIVNVDGVDLDLKVRDGILEVGRPDKTWLGSVRVVEPEPEPDPIEEVASPQDVAPVRPILPQGWSIDEAGIIYDSDGKSIMGVNSDGS